MIAVLFCSVIQYRYVQLELPESLKGTSGLALFRVFPKLRQRFRKGRIWSRSYYVGTAGEVSSEVIRRYIERVEHD